MNRWLCLALCFLLNTCGFGPGTAEPESVNRIRVSLTVFEEGETLFVRLSGRWRVQELSRGHVLSVGEVVSLHLQEGRLAVDGRALRHGCRVEPLSLGATCTFEDRRYRGTIEVIPRVGKETHLVLDADLEDYIAGVVACESGRHFHPEALKAQAVAARTFAALRLKVERRDPEVFDVYGTTRDQVFKGIGPIRSEHRDAARVTSGRILTFRSRVLPAFYHSTCGGHTINSAEIGLTRQWLSPLKGVPCDHCSRSKYYRWKHDVTAAEIAKALRGRVIGEIRDVRVEATDQGVVSRVLFRTSRGELPVGVRVFRSSLGKSVRSGRFDVTWRKGRLEISGRGWGHGSGMCQFGAEGQARMGRGFREILEYYYPGSRLSDI